MRARDVLGWLAEHFAEEIRTIHELKEWPDNFQAMLSGDMRHMVTVADKDFQVGDLLYLREWSPVREAYTGRHAFRQITYITRGGDGPHCMLLPDLCVLSIR